MTHSIPLTFISVVRCFVLDGDGHLLALKRNDRLEFNPGLWECPGGKMDEGHLVQEEAYREVLEETGYHIGPVESVAHVMHHVSHSRTNAHICIYSVIGCVAHIETTTMRLSKEHEDAVWVTHREFLNLELTKESRKAARVLRSFISKY